MYNWKCAAEIFQLKEDSVRYDWTAYTLKKITHMQRNEIKRSTQKWLMSIKKDNSVGISTQC